MAVANVPDAVVDPVKLACEAILRGRVDADLPQDASPTRQRGDIVIDLAGGRDHFCDDDDVRRIAEAWSQAESDPDHIVEIDLSLNRVTDEGVKALIDALAARPCRLAALDFDGNELTDSSLSYITEKLLTSKDKKTPASSLRRLDLSSNRITDSGVGSLVQGVINEQNKTLQSLQLRSNKLGNSSMTRLSTWLEEPTCPLTSLHVSGNEFTEAVLEDVGSALLTNVQLTDLNLSNTMTVVNDITDFAECVKKHEGLLAVSLQFDGKKRENAVIAATIKRNKEAVKLRSDYVVQLKLRHAAEVASLRRRIEELENEVAQQRKEKEQPPPAQENSAPPAS